MGCPTVDTFLCCLDLETGGFIIGYVTIILSVVAISGLSLFIAFASVGVANIPTDSINFVILVGVLVICAIYIAYLLVLLAAGILLIQGIRKRDPSLLILIMILMCIGKVLAFLQIIGTGTSGISYGIIFAMFNFYLYICIRSLYLKLKREKSLEGIIKYYTRQQSTSSNQPHQQPLYVM